MLNVRLSQLFLKSNAICIMKAPVQRKTIFIGSCLCIFSVPGLYDDTELYIGYILMNDLKLKGIKCRGLQKEVQLWLIQMHITSKTFWRKKSS